MGGGCFAVLLLAASVQTAHSIYCEEKNCYEVLGLEPSSWAEAPTEKEIKKAYRKLSLVYHPDKNSAEDAQEIFIEIANAYEILSDEARRKSYDYFVAHPDAHFTNEMNIYYDTYAPQVQQPTLDMTLTRSRLCGAGA